jgi:hypothetical protein
MINEDDYRLARSCLTKVLHGRAGLPRGDEHDSFSHWMRSAAAKFRTVASSLFPHAQTAGGGEPETRWVNTRRILQAAKAVRYGTLVAEQCRCQVDIMEPDGDIIRLYTFAAKSVDFGRLEFGLEFSYKPGRLKAEWRDTIELAAFRVRVARELFPEHRIIPLLVVPVEGLKASHEGLHGIFSHDGRHYQGDSTAGLASAAGLLRVVSIVKECDLVASTVGRRIETLRSFLARPWRPAIGYQCKKCEFHAGGIPSGFEQCWGPLASVQPSMFELGYMYFIQDEDGQPVANRLAREGRVSLWDIPRELIRGEYAERQLMQLDGTRSGREIIKPELAEDLAKIFYPLHCIDLESLQSWLPPHKDGRVNDLVLFQLSVHTREGPDAAWKHLGWLNEERSHPNRRFLSALRAAIGEGGTVCVWTQHEESSFKSLLTELVRSGDDSDDVQWLRRFLSSGRILDLHAVCFRRHFHPLFGGRTSIKKVLAALFSEDSPVKAREPYCEFPADREPYQVLKEAGAIADGCQAMQGYLDVIGPDRARSEAACKALLRYCYVDTLAMCFILEYWAWRLAEKSAEEAMTISVGDVVDGVAANTTV